VDVKVAGTYKVSALYGNAASAIKFSINNQRKRTANRARCRPVAAVGEKSTPTL
jgi:hypothetical protein